MTQDKHGVITWICSEPGDCTRYQYGVAWDGQVWRIVSWGGSVRYPEYITAYDVQSFKEWVLDPLEEEETQGEGEVFCHACVDRYMKTMNYHPGVNPFTMCEVLRGLVRVSSQGDGESLE